MGVCLCFLSPFWHLWNSFMNNIITGQIVVYSLCCFRCFPAQYGRLVGAKVVTENPGRKHTKPDATRASCSSIHRRMQSRGSSRHLPGTRWPWTLFIVWQKCTGCLTGFHTPLLTTCYTCSVNVANSQYLGLYSLVTWLSRPPHLLSDTTMENIHVIPRSI